MVTRHRENRAYPEVEKNKAFHLPCEIKKMSRQKLHPWLTNELLELQRDREYFFDRARKTNNPGDWFIASRLRNRVNQAVRSAKADYIKGELEHCQHDPKKYWRVIDSGRLETKIRVLRSHKRKYRMSLTTFLHLLAQGWPGHFRICRVLQTSLHQSITVLNLIWSQ